MKRPIAISFLVTLTLALGWGCSQKTISETDQAAADSTLVPDSEVFGATVYLYDRDVVTAEIRANRIRRFEAIDSTMGYVLDIDFFDSVGQVSSNLIGDSGVIREASNKLEVHGEVVVITSDSVKLETDYLRWSPEIGRIETEAYVKLTRGDDIMTGWGMEADPDLGRLRILSQVSGSISENEAAKAEDKAAPSEETTE
jgi:LPS export ABC transporter protein LptC